MWNVFTRSWKRLTEQRWKTRNSWSVIWRASLKRTTEKSANSKRRCQVRVFPPVHISDWTQILLEWVLTGYLVTDGSSPKRETAGVHRLVQQITSLQTKNSELYERALTSENDLSETKEKLEVLQRKIETLNCERNELQESLQFIRLRSSKVPFALKKLNEMEWNGGWRMQWYRIIAEHRQNRRSQIGEEVEERKRATSAESQQIARSPTRRSSIDDPSGWGQMWMSILADLNL